MTKIIKIDGISCVDELSKVAGKGADVLSIEASALPNNYQEFFIELDKILSIACNSKIALSISGDDLIQKDFIPGIEVRSVALNVRVSDFEKVIERMELKNFSGKLYFTEISASYDDDVNWLLPDLDSTSFNSEEILYQIDLLPEKTNPWKTLVEECPQFDNELQLKDLKDLSQNESILFSLDFNEANALNAFFEFTNAKGFFLRLKTMPERNSMRQYPFNKLIRALEVLKVIKADSNF